MEYWNSMVDDGTRFVSAKSMTFYIFLIAIIVQFISLMITPSNLLIWNALGFIIATNLGAVLLAIKAQMSAEEISDKTSAAFTADFYHTFHMMTSLKRKMAEKAEADGKTLRQEIDDLGDDMYDVIRGYLATYSQHKSYQVETIEKIPVEYETVEELFE